MEEYSLVSDIESLASQKDAATRKLDAAEQQLVALVRNTVMRSTLIDCAGATGGATGGVGAGAGGATGGEPELFATRAVVEVRPTFCNCMWSGKDVYFERLPGLVDTDEAMKMLERWVPSLTFTFVWGKRKIVDDIF